MLRISRQLILLKSRLKKLRVVVSVYHFISRTLRRTSARRALSRLRRSDFVQVSSNLRTDPRCGLNSLCERYGSDKGGRLNGHHPYPWPPHQYADFYSQRLFNAREEILAVFECGIGTNNGLAPSNMSDKGRPGASLRVWRDYFPKAQVVGADIDRSVLFTDHRISTYWVDQRESKSVSNMWEQVEVSEFDLMVDDGLHTFEAGVNLFNGSIHKLKSSGMYVIEDVTPRDLRRWQEYFQDAAFSVEFIAFHNAKRFRGEQSLVAVRKL